MNQQMPFGDGPDRDLGPLIRDAYQGPDPARFLARLAGVLDGLPSRISQWDVLAAWARPGVVAAAAAAAFLLGVAWWQNWRRHSADPGAVQSSVSVAILDAAPAAPGETQILYAVLEGR